MFLDRRIVERVKEMYPEGCRVELDRMCDMFVTIEPGTQGTVAKVDDVGTIHVDWDGYGRLGVVYGEDSCHRI